MEGEITWGRSCNTIYKNVVEDWVNWDYGSWNKKRLKGYFGS